MWQIVYTAKFLKSAKRLPKQTKQKLAQKLEVLRSDPFNLLLHTKALSGTLSGFYSFRITRDWRVIFYFPANKQIKVIEVAHRKNIYR